MFFVHHHTMSNGQYATESYAYETSDGAKEKFYGLLSYAYNQKSSLDFFMTEIVDEYGHQTVKPEVWHKLVEQSESEE